MKLQRLNLLAFGHFTKVALDFDHPEFGFHLVYGPNEAGKSTALRGVRSLLYGVPPQSRDTFLHAGKEVRVGGVLADGERRLSVVRRKGRKNTLLRAVSDDGRTDGETITEVELRDFLGGTDEDLFQAMFGLDHEGLREGAQQLLHGEGSLGESLFGASVGAGSIRPVLVQLRESADQLFTSKGRGAKRINQRIADVRGAQQRVQQTATSATAFLAQEQNLSQLSAAIEDCRGKRATLRRRKNALERQLRNLPQMARRESFRLQLAELSNVPELSQETRAQRLAAVDLKEKSQKQVDFELAEVARIEQQLEGLSLPQGLLELDAAVVAQLNHRLGQYRKALIDLPKRQGELKQIEEDAQELLVRMGRDVDLAAVEELRLSKPEEARLRRLNAERTDFDATLRERSVKLTEAQSNLAARRKELQQVAPETATRAVFKSASRARQRLDLGQRAATARERARRALQQAEKENRGLQPLCDSLPALAVLSVPSDKSRGPLVLELGRLAEQHRELQRRTAELAERRIELERERDQVKALGEIPTLNGLAQLRAQRDQLTQRLAAVLGLDVPEGRSGEARPGQLPSSQLPSSQLPSSQLPSSKAPTEKLAEAKGKSSVASDVAETATIRQLFCELLNVQREVDEYADSLRSEAGRGAKLAVLEAELDALGKSEQLVMNGERQNLERRDLLSAEYRALWLPHVSAPLSPEAMEQWVQERSGVLAHYELSLEATDEAKQLEAQLAEAIGELSQELERAGEAGRMLWESPLQLVERAEAWVEERNEHNQRRLGLMRDINHAERAVEVLSTDLAEAKEAQRAWRGQWQKGLKALGLERDARPDEVNAALDSLTALFHRMDEARALRRRIAGMERDSSQLQQDVAAIAQEALPHARQLAVDAAAELLIREHQRVTDEAKERDRLLADLTLRKTKVQRGELAVRQSDQVLRDLFARANVTSIGELQQAEAQAERRGQLRKQLEELEDELLAHGEGLSLEAMASEIEGIEAEEIREQVAGIDPEIEAIETRLEQLLQQKVGAEEALRQLEGGAAEAAEELAAAQALLQQDVQRYRRLRVAERILEEEVERYRAAHQGPVMRRAKGLFPQLTLGQYADLSIGFDKRDAPVLQCVRSAGQEVPIEGLSDGTRDQLFLALRLATIERYLERNAAMPVVLDDILIHFDDDRARAALAALGQLSERTQVLFFTHHRRMTELATEAVSSRQLRIQELPSPATTGSKELGGSPVADLGDPVAAVGDLGAASGDPASAAGESVS